MNFSRLADAITEWTGSALASGLAALIVLLWLVGLPWFGLDNTGYQLLINSSTTIATFLMVFLIQHSTNRSTRAIQTKLDAIIHGLSDVDDALTGIEDEPAEAIRAIQQEIRDVT